MIDARVGHPKMRRPEFIVLGHLLAGLCGATIMLAGSSGNAAVLISGSSITTTVGGYRFDLPSCAGYACESPNVGQMAVPAGQAGISITGLAGIVLQSVVSPGSGDVDTLLEFKVGGLTNISSLSILATGCGDNPSVSGCGTSTLASASTVTMKTYSDAALTDLVGSSQLSFSQINPDASQAVGTESFGALSTIYITLAADSYTGLYAGSAGFADFKKINLTLNTSAPEPASVAVLSSGLISLWSMRRRRVVTGLRAANA